MSVALRIQCDHRGEDREQCGRHVDLDAVMGASELAMLSPLRPFERGSDFWIEALYALPKSWRVEGDGAGFKAFCADHA